MILSAFIVLLTGAAAAPLLFRFLGARAGWLLALLPLCLFTALIALLPGIAAGRPVTERTPWIPSLGVDLAFRIDGLALLFLLVILGIGALILVYGSGYLKGHPLQGRFFGYLLLFMAAMCGMVSADNTILLFVFWELTGIASYLLIGYYHEDAQARSSALQALLVTFLGGQALLAGLVLLSIATGGSFSLSETLEKGAQITAHPWYPAILLLILLGAFTKSAQFPFHFWLPGAMSAPAPVSAYLHSATMVNAGIFLMARMAPALAGTELWRALATTAGVATMLAGALLAYPQADLKRLLAYSTVSALGTMILLLGLDTMLAAKAAMLFFLVHALYKGALFMAAGTVDHETGTRDVRMLSGLAKAMPLTTAAAVGAGLSMCGLPPLIGFISKELLYEAKLASPYLGPVVTAAGVAANVLMVAVGLSVAFRPFHGSRSDTPKPPHEGKWTLWLPPLLLAAIGILFGIAPGLIDSGLIAPAVSAVRAQETEVTLKLWHGINPVLMLSIATVAAGVVVFRLHHRARLAAERIAQSAPGSLGPARIYEWLLEGMVRSAKFLTQTLQHGSLRGYVGVAVTVMVVLTGAALLRVWNPSALVWDFSDLRLYEGVLLIAMIAGALFAALANSRLAAIASLGIVGFGVALVFGMHGAPDLALTQLLVETLTLVILVLVIYRLPRIASRSTPRQQIADAILALTAGSVITVLLLIAMNMQPEPILRDYFVQNSLQAKGRNVVNVILVDFRALDTLGEITVLAAAALGVGGLIWLRPRRKQPGGGEN